MTHPVTPAAVPAGELFTAALTELAQDDGEQPLPYLTSLHERGSRTVFETAAALLTSSDDLRRELGARVLQWIISALGYHAASHALNEVLAFASHPHPAVRFHVAAALPSLVDPRRAQDTAVAALQRLCHDDDADIRWYAFYALSRETAGVAARQVTAIADALTDDPDGQVRDLALAHLSS